MQDSEVQQVFKYGVDPNDEFIWDKKHELEGEVEEPPVKKLATKDEPMEEANCEWTQPEE